MFILQHDIFEGNDPSPVVTHLFYGNTKEEALGILNAHAKYDEFLRASLTTLNFHGILLRTTYSWRTRP